MAEAVQSTLQKNKKDEEELLRLCYLGREADLEALAGSAGAARVQLARDKKQRQGLHLAASNGKTATVRALIARYTCDADAEDEDGRVPLHFAAIQGHSDTVACLCMFGRAWVDSSDNQDNTPLHLAARMGHTLTCLELLDQGASGHGRNAKGLTALGEAVIAGHPETVEALGERDFAFLQDRPKSFSLLHLACGQSRAEVASYLIGKVPSLLNDTHNPQRLSPLHTSVMARSAACVQVLIQAGCKADLQDSNGDTAMDFLDADSCLSGEQSANAAEGEKHTHHSLPRQMNSLPRLRVCPFSPFVSH